MGTVEGINQGFYENIEEAAAHIVDVLSGILGEYHLRSHE